MLLLKNARVFSPKPLGKKDVLICYDKIAQVGEALSPSLPDLEVLDVSKKILVPGFIDQHVHITGGGGEGGLHTRTPELQLSDAIRAGVTTLVGVLGTDGFTRSVESLLAKTKALNNEGLTAWCLTGSYQYPPVTLTGSVAKDIIFLSEVIGCKLAFSDNRGTHPTREELIRLASEIRMAALIGGKPGVLHMHIGAAPEGIEPIMEIVRATDIPVYHFRPTHMGRHPNQAAAFTRLGGYADVTAGPEVPEFFPALIENSVPELLTMSSDSNGSMPIWDEKREHIVGMGVGQMTTLYNTIRELVTEKNMPLESALPYITVNVAKALNLYPRKGAVQAGSDADLVLLDEDLNIEGVIARGQKMMLQKQVLIKGAFEK